MRTGQVGGTSWQLWPAAPSISLQGLPAVALGRGCCASAVPDQREWEAVLAYIGWLMIPQPILLIHGLNGSPSNWTGPDDRFPEFLAAHGYDPALIRVFNYGYEVYNGKRTYNNLGDIRQIAHRLDQ